jgi:hypothetical protein
MNKHGFIALKILLDVGASYLKLYFVLFSQRSEHAIYCVLLIPLGIKYG